MTKLNYFAIIVCTICLFVLPTSSLAKMTKMTETELEQTTAQAGFSDILGIIQVNKDEETGSYYFGSEKDGYISLADISYDGLVGLNSAIIATKNFTDNGTTGVEYVMDGNIIEIDNYSSTLRIGSETGIGDSLGSLHIEQMILSVNGTIRIAAD